MQFGVETYQSHLITCSRYYRPCILFPFAMARGKSMEKEFVLLIGLLENLVYGGVILGWPSLVFVLKDIGYFSEDCWPTEENTTISTDKPSTNGQAGTTDFVSVSPTAVPPQTCPSQEASLQLVFSVATAVHLFSYFPVGFYFDKLGFRWTRLPMTICLFAGHLMMALSHPGVSYLLFPAMILLVVGGVTVLVSSLEIACLFRHHKSTAITALSSMYGSAMAVFLVLKVAYEAGFPMKTSFFILAGGTLFLNVGTAILPPLHLPRPIPKGYRLIRCCGGENSEDTSLVQETKESPQPAPNESGLENLGYVADETDSAPEKNDNSLTAGEGTSGTTSELSILEDPKSQFKSFGDCLRSPIFLVLLFWQVSLDLATNFMFGIVNYYVTELANNDQEVVSSFTNIFTIIQLSSIFLGPVAGLVMDRNKLKPCAKAGQVRTPYDDIKDSCLPVAVSSLLMTATTALLLVPVLTVQYVTSMLFSVFRVFFFGTGPAVIGLIFPAEFFGRVFGLSRCIGGFVTLLQYPLFILIQDVLNGDPFYVMVGFVVVELLTVVYPVFLYIDTRKHLTRLNAREETKQIQ